MQAALRELQRRTPGFSAACGMRRNGRDEDGEQAVLLEPMPQFRPRPVDVYFSSITWPPFRAIRKQQEAAQKEPTIAFRRGKIGLCRVQG